MLMSYLEDKNDYYHTKIIDILKNNLYTYFVLTRCRTYFLTNSDGLKLLRIKLRGYKNR